jgi:hypothetical protein
VVIRSPWDYTSRRAQFVEWARSVPRLANPADIVAWNTDKHYLSELAEGGVPVVPTRWLEPGAAVELPSDRRWVLKPAVGAGSFDAATFALDDSGQVPAARAHAERLLAAGQSVMLQPYLDAIDVAGEMGVIYVGGRFSHAITKSAMLGGQERQAVAGLYKAETITARDADPAALRLADDILSRVPGGAERLVYARVDLVPDDAGRPLLIELELTEPSLFMATSPGSELRFADAIAASIGARAHR